LFVQIETVPIKSPISLREVARKFSNLGGQGTINASVGWQVNYVYLNAMIA